MKEGGDVFGVQHRISIQETLSKYSIETQITLDCKTDIVQQHFFPLEIHCADKPKCTAQQFMSRKYLVE